MKYLCLLLCLLGVPALAQGVNVKSGEHGPFTRLVFTYSEPVDWVLGRSAQGYALRLKGPSRVYDLSDVYRRITRDRLRSIWVDPASNDLLLGVDCACHAIPFELGPTVLVIDIRDGPPPTGSSFELSLEEGSPQAPLQAAERKRPRRSNRVQPVYDWLAPPTAAAGHNALAPDSLADDLRLKEFRAMLIAEVGRGATQGVVEVAVPEERMPQEPSGAPNQEEPNNARAALDALPGIDISTDRTAAPDVTVVGANCPEPTDMASAAPPEGEDAVTLLAQARANVLTEFDIPDPTQVTQAVDTYLYFGLGAEARWMLDSFLPLGQSDPLRRSISFLVDGAPLPDNPFEGMQNCDSAAALWALLAADDRVPLAFVNGAAVSRSFLAMPAELRAALGPDIARRLLASGDAANAEVVRQAFARATSEENPAVGLLAATQALQAGDPAAAEAALPQDAQGENALNRLLTLVEARFLQRKAVDGKDLQALEAFAFEHGDGPLRPQLDRALAHAAALGGDYAAAFGHAGQDLALERDVWMLLAETGTETPLLTFAVGLDATQRAALPPSIRGKIAERLLAAGLPNAATEWVQSDDPESDLAARIALANGDSRGALRMLSRLVPEVDPDLLATAYIASGEFGAAANTYRTAGNVAQAARLERWGGKWVAPSGPDADDADVWETVADYATSKPDDPAAPVLQSGQARLEVSASTRQAIADLLAATPLPERPDGAAPDL